MQFNHKIKLWNWQFPLPPPPKYLKGSSIIMNIFMSIQTVDWGELDVHYLYKINVGMQSFVPVWNTSL